MLAPYWSRSTRRRFYKGDDGRQSIRLLRQTAISCSRRAMKSSIRSVWIRRPRRAPAGVSHGYLQRTSGGLEFGRVLQTRLISFAEAGNLSAEHRTLLRSHVAAVVFRLVFSAP